MQYPTSIIEKLQKVFAKQDAKLMTITIRYKIKKINFKQANGLGRFIKIVQNDS